MAEPFTLLAMVDKALPAPEGAGQEVALPDASGAAEAPKTINRRGFLEESALRSVTSQFMPGFLRNLVSGKVSLPPTLAEDEKASLISTISTFLESDNKLREFIVGVRRTFLSSESLITGSEAEQKRWLEEKARELEELRDLHRRTGRELLIRRKEVLASDLPDSRSFESDGTLYVGSSIVSSQPSEMLYIRPNVETMGREIAVLLEEIEELRRVAGIEGRSVNPLEATKPQQQAIQKLVDEYARSRSRVEEGFSAFRQCVWDRDYTNLDRAIEEAADTAERNHGKALDYANKLLDRGKEFSLYSRMGLVKKPWESRGIATELMQLEADNRKPLEAGEMPGQLSEYFRNMAQEVLDKRRLIDMLKDEGTILDHSISLFKITFKGEAEERCSELHNLMGTLYPDLEIKAARNMVFIDRTSPEDRRPGIRPDHELQQALETIMDRKGPPRAPGASLI